jgi:CubicO group peptidase (beta-lactamase class C family)
MNRLYVRSALFIFLMGFVAAFEPGPARLGSAPLEASQQGQVQAVAPLKTGVAKEKLIVELERMIPDLMKKAAIPGLSIAVVRHGKLLWAKGFGFKSAITNEPVTEATIFEAASLTKPFFAYAAMKLVESGELSLDKPLYEYLPRELIEQGLGHSLDLEGFRADWLRKITARHVLSHSSGLPHGERGKPYPIFFEPGTKYRYSAEGYFLLQKVIEHLKGESLDALMQKTAIDPLGMTASRMVWQDRYEKEAAVGHDVLGETDGKFRKRTEAHAAATLYTTARDYAQFVIAMLNDTGLKPETIQEMLKPQIDITKDVSWGLGFGLERTANGDAFWQWGDYGTFRNYIVAYKNEKSGLVYLTNSFNGLSIGQDLVKAVFGGGEEPAIAYLNYDQYNSPGTRFFRAVLEKGGEEASRLFTEFRKTHPDKFDEAVVNRIGYQLIGAKRYKEAIAVLRLNIEAYPFSANVYDSLAEAYLNSGDKELAAAYYKKTLEAIPSDPRPDKDFLERIRKGAEEKLKELGKKD